jgi:hypothetical protein
MCARSDSGGVGPCEEDWRASRKRPPTPPFSRPGSGRAPVEHFGGRRRLWCCALRGGATVGFARCSCRRPRAAAGRSASSARAARTTWICLPRRHEVGVSERTAFLGEAHSAWDWAIAAGATGGGDRAGGGRRRRTGDAWRVAGRDVSVPGAARELGGLREAWQKLRGNIGYYERRWRNCTRARDACDGRDAGGGLEAFFRAAQRRWNRRWLPGVRGAAARRVPRGRCRALLCAGWLRTAHLSLAASPAALYCFPVRRRCADYLGVFEPGSRAVAGYDPDGAGDPARY